MTRTPPPHIIPYTPEEDEIIQTIIETRPAGVSIREAMKHDLRLLPGRTIDGILFHYNKYLKPKDTPDGRKKGGPGRPPARPIGRPKKPAAAEDKKDKQDYWNPWTAEEDAILWNSVELTMHKDPRAQLRTALKETVDQLPGRTFSSVINRYYMLRTKMGETGTQYEPEQMAFTEPGPPARQPGNFVPYTGEPRPQPAPERPIYYEPPQPSSVPPVPVNQQPAPPASVESGPLVSKAEEFIRELFGVVEHNSALRQEVQTLRSDAASVNELRAALEAEQAKVARLQAKIKELEEDQGAFLKLMDKARQIGRTEQGV